MTHLVAVGGSDAGIAAALRARELDPSTDVTVVLADEFPNFSICGIPSRSAASRTGFPATSPRKHPSRTAPAPTSKPRG